ncbi:hypothetical protein [Sphingorhabdus sp.]|uniref:hypothetical protein n=1 Tax=Sphingorhabdus sp. TaxID=1902408 RepID=UPI00391DEC11
MQNDRALLDQDGPSEISALRSLAAAVADSVPAYERAAREGEELYRPIFLTRSKERKEMVNELHARILALGGVTEAETDDPHGFATSMNRTLDANASVIDSVVKNEAKLRSVFVAAIDQHTGDTETLLRTHLFALERSEEELRRLLHETGAPPHL